MKSFLVRLARWLLRKGARTVVPVPQLAGSLTIDAYHRLRTPTQAELIAELKNTAWTCATINASACAAPPPRLYVTKSRGQASPRRATRRLTAAALRPPPDAPDPGRFGPHAAP